MPRFDRSGPMGAGPMTGGGRGLCGRPADMPVYGMGYGYESGTGYRHGFGRRCGRGFGPAYSGYSYPRSFDAGRPAGPVDELDMLRTRADGMRKSLDAIQDRISELENRASE